LHLMALLNGRSRGWRVRHSLHFAFQEPGDREAGGGARAPWAAARAASLAAPPAHAVAALPCPSPRHRPVVPASFANGAGEFGAGGLRIGLGEPDPIQGPETPRRRRGRGSNTCLALGPGGCSGQPRAPVNRMFLSGRPTKSEPRGVSEVVRPWIWISSSQALPRREQVSDFAERNDSTGAIWSTVAFCFSRGFVRLHRRRYRSAARLRARKFSPTVVEAPGMIALH